MNEEIIELLKQNRDKLNPIDGNFEQNDYSTNTDIDNEFYSELSKIDLKNVKNKTQFFSLINELAKTTVDKTVSKVSKFSAVSDSLWGHDLKISELYLKDLVDKLMKNISVNIPLAKFYKTQIDYLASDLKTHHWGEQFVNELLSKIGYEQISQSVEKMVDSTSWSLYWNEDYKNNKDMIKYAISRDPNEINNVPDNLKEDKQFMMELLEINPNCYFGMSSAIKSDKEIAKFIIYKDWRQFVGFADDSLKNEQFLNECNLETEDIKTILESIEEYKPNVKQDNSQDTNQKPSNQVFDTEAYKCSSFLEELNKCNSNEDIVKFVDSIVNRFTHDESAPEQIGTSGSFFSKTAYTNGGTYNGFIDPSIKISNATTGFSYHIYDRDYLYAFALGIRKLNLPSDTNLLPFVMKYLDSYFGFPKDNIDRRDAVLYNFAVSHAEEFYKKYNIPIDEDMGAVDQMQLSGDFPLSALKGTFSAQCVERSALAQNIMKLCGYNSSIMYGDCESRGQNEGHCWNSIYDKDGNVLIIDFSNTVYSYKDGQFFKREPYAYTVSGVDYLAQDGLLEMPDYHYENGKRVRDNKNRKYAVGKTMNMQDEMTTGNKSR